MNAAVMQLRFPPLCSSDPNSSIDSGSDSASVKPHKSLLATMVIQPPSAVVTTVFPSGTLRFDSPFQLPLSPVSSSSSPSHDSLWKPFLKFEPLPLPCENGVVAAFGKVSLERTIERLRRANQQSYPSLVDPRLRLVCHGRQSRLSAPFDPDELPMRIDMLAPALASVYVTTLVPTPAPEREGCLVVQSSEARPARDVVLDLQSPNCAERRRLTVAKGCDVGSGLFVEPFYQMRPSQLSGNGDVWTHAVVLLASLIVTVTTFVYWRHVNFV